MVRHVIMDIMVVMDIIYSKCYNGVIMVGGFADEAPYIQHVMDVIT